MMDLSAVSSVLNQDSPTATTKKGLSQEDFMKILVSEMTNQDPMKPMDNKEFLSQLVQLQNLESSSNLSSSIKELATMNQLSSASSLIGHTVTGKAEGGEDINGKVEKVVMNNKTAYVVVDGVQLPLDQVQEVEE